MTDAATYAEMIASEIDAVIDLTASLVAVDSPPDDVVGVERVAQILMGALASAGCEVELLRPLEPVKLVDGGSETLGKVGLHMRVEPLVVLLQRNPRSPRPRTRRRSNRPRA